MFWTSTRERGSGDNLSSPTRPGVRRRRLNPKILPHARCNRQPYSPPEKLQCVLHSDCLCHRPYRQPLPPGHRQFDEGRRGGGRGGGLSQPHLRRRPCRPPPSPVRLPLCGKSRGVGLGVSGIQLPPLQMTTSTTWASRSRLCVDGGQDFQAVCSLSATICISRVSSCLSRNAGSWAGVIPLLS